MQTLTRFLAVLMVWTMAVASLTATNVHALDENMPLDRVASRYVKLILAIGEHEPGYVDAYYGPKEWQEEVKTNRPHLAALFSEASSLLDQVGLKTQKTSDPAIKQRLRFLSKQLIAARARVEMLQGKKFSFDEETSLLFDAVVPPVSQEDLEASLAQLDSLIPGEGTLQDRFVAFRDEFTVPKDKLEQVFAAAILACKDRTSVHLDLPAGERFTTEFVTDKPWSGYNWYQGDAVSLIQVNTDLPSLIDSAVNLGCHEGYPGHHVFNAMLESNLVNGKGWMEFSVYPLYSPQSLLAEGTASFARFMAFPGSSQTAFEAETLYPLAGLDPARAAEYSNALAALSGLRYARIEGARRYLDGKISREELINWLARYQLTSRDRAEQGVRFIETYRGYVINYTLGSDLSSDYVDRKAGTSDHTKRWDAYKVLLSTPLTASMLKE